jgi:hypothetical protein
VNGAEQPKQGGQVGNVGQGCGAAPEAGQFRDRAGLHVAPNLLLTAVGALDRGQHHLLQGMVATAQLGRLAVLAGVHMPEDLVAQSLDVQAKAEPQGVNGIRRGFYRAFHRGHSVDTGTVELLNSWRAPAETSGWIRLLPPRNYSAPCSHALSSCA